MNHSSVNVDKAQLLGKIRMESFERSWPGGFHDSIPKIVTTMALSRKHIVVDAKVFDTETSMQEPCACSIAHAILTQPR